MAEMRLFGNKIRPACKYCELALRPPSKDGAVLCKKHGVVRQEYHCRHYRYDPLRRVPARPPALMEFDEEEFKL